MLQKIWSKLKLISAILACAVFLGAGLYGVLAFFGVYTVVRLAGLLLSRLFGGRRKR